MGHFSTAGQCGSCGWSMGGSRRAARRTLSDPEGSCQPSKGNSVGRGQGEGGSSHGELEEVRSGEKDRKVSAGFSEKAVRF